MFAAPNLRHAPKRASTVGVLTICGNHLDVNWLPREVADTANH